MNFRTSPSSASSAFCVSTREMTLAVVMASAAEPKHRTPSIHSGMLLALCTFSAAARLSVAALPAFTMPPFAFAATLRRLGAGAARRAEHSPREAGTGPGAGAAKLEVPARCAVTSTVQCISRISGWQKSPLRLLQARRPAPEAWSGWAAALQVTNTGRGRASTRPPICGGAPEELG